MRPRIALTLTQCWHRVPGGTATAALRLAEALATRDEFDLVGVGARGAHTDGFAPPLPVVQLRLRYPLLYPAWHRGLEAPERVTGPVDVVHATAPVCPPVRSAALVATLHDLFPLTDPANLTPRGVRTMTRAYAAMRTRAAVIMCSSRQTMAAAIDAGFRADRLRLVPLGADPHAVTDDDRARVRRRYQLDRPYFLWVGTIEPRKNLAMLLSAFAAADPAEVDLLLVGPDGWTTDLDALVADRAGRRSRVRRVGFVPEADLAVLMDGAMALLFPSHREGFGLPAVEAMAQGTAVVGAAGTAIDEIVGTTGRLIDPGDVDGWADTIGEIAAAPTWSRDQATLVRARAALFTWDRTAELTAAVYHEAIAAPAPAHDR